MKPSIGINLDIDAGPPSKAAAGTSYFEAVTKAGGIPFFLPPLPDADLKECLSRLDGVVLIGGRDYSPASYGEEAHPNVILMHPHREDFDFRLLKAALEIDLPVLAICAGQQLLNICLGGNLIQDLKSVYPETGAHHHNREVKGLKHVVKIEPNSMLAEFYEELCISVPTSHRQAVKDLGKGLVITAYAEDGVVEAVELPGRRFIVGVQWHPERDYAGNEGLFKAFIKASGMHQNNKQPFVTLMQDVHNTGAYRL
jgi:gamma-glutamyl-gamma-aminobutyrate hydrolase PuuD